MSARPSAGKSAFRKTTPLCLAVLFGWTLGLHGLAVAQVATPLRTQGGAIVDAAGREVHLTGVNWYGAESKDYVVGGLQAAPLESIVRQIRSRGFNVVRLPWSNQLVELNPIVSDYALKANPQFHGKHAMAIFRQVVDALTGAGIMVILDDHVSSAGWCCNRVDGNGLWYSAAFPEANWLADWQKMARRFRDDPLVIGADLRNEPRNGASWGGDPATDWSAAAQRGGDAVLAADPNLLIFIEGTSFATDLRGMAASPVHLSQPNRVVFEAHDYDFDHKNLTDYASFLAQILPAWGYLATGPNPQPLLLGEFGTCNTADTCVVSDDAADKGRWFGFLTRFLQQNHVDWTYWSLNGTETSGKTRVYGKTDSYGILDADWSADANSALTARLREIEQGAGQ